MISQLVISNAIQFIVLELASTKTRFDEIRFFLIRSLKIEVAPQREL